MIDWLIGYPSGGVTGPTTPAIMGATVRGYCAYREWVETGKNFPKVDYEVITSQRETIAICIDQQDGTKGEDIAKEIVAAVRLLRRLKSSKDMTHRAILHDFENHKGAFSEG